MRSPLPNLGYGTHHVRVIDFYEVETLYSKRRSWMVGLELIPSGHYAAIFASVVAEQVGLTDDMGTALSKRNRDVAPAQDVLLIEATKLVNKSEPFFIGVYRAVDSTVDEYFVADSGETLDEFTARFKILRLGRNMGALSERVARAKTSFDVAKAIYDTAIAEAAAEADHQDHAYQT